MSESSNLLPVREADVVKWYAQAETLLASAEWVRKQSAPSPAASSSSLLIGGLSSLNPTGVSAQGTTEKVSIIDIAHAHGGGGRIMGDTVHHVLATIKEGLALGYHIEDLYVKATGLDDLERQNMAKKLSPSDVPELQAKQQTRAMIAVHVTAAYTVWSLSAFRSEEVSNVSMDKPEIAEFPVGSAVQARKSMMYYLGKGLSDPSITENELAFVRFTLLYFRSILDSVLLRKDNQKYTDAFTGKKYKLEKKEFVIDGFHMLAERAVVSVEFKRLGFHEVVGNRLAKHAAKRAIDRLCCYDPERKMNPILELGGLGPIRLGYGPPGTGKSMLIAAIATLLSDRCKAIGIPFLFHPLPDGLISSYQGGSAERMDAWMRVLRDPTKIVYAPIDDAENVFKNRALKDVSEGERGVQGVFLRQTEGAYAIPRGNTLIDFCTNLPEQIDPATMSRIVERYPIDGARTEHDMLDQDHLAFKRYRDLDAKFDDTEDPRDYTFFDDQQGFGAKGERRERYEKPRTEKVVQIYERVLRQHSPKEKRFFAKFAVALQGAFPVFTSRDIRNIQSAVTSRILDFDMPDEWFEDPKRFAHLPYDEKKGMLIELMKANMEGLSLADIRREELFRYADGVADMADVAFDRDVEAVVRQARVHQAAERKLRTA